MTQREFILTVLDAATGVPGIQPAATAAHAANESRYGASQLAAEFHNLFGLKKGGSWSGETVKLPTWEVVDGKTVQTTAEFRLYRSWRESIEDYAAVIKRVYPWAAEHAHEALQFLFGIFLMGPLKWATDPAAFNKAVAILDAHDLLRPDQVRLGRHEIVVDNSPSVSKALAQLGAAIGGKPAVLGPHLVTRTPRPDGTHKLDLREVDE